MFLLPVSCRKSLVLTEDDLPKTDSSSTIDPSDTTDDVASFTGSYNIAITYSGTSFSGGSAGSSLSASSSAGSSGPGGGGHGRW